MKYDGHNYYTLSTGRTFYAHGGIIGLSTDDPEVHEGYDGEITIEREKLFSGDDWVSWSDEERAELADYMVAL